MPRERMNEILDKFVWFNSDDINRFVVAIKKQYCDVASKIIGLLGTNFFYLIKNHYKFCLQKEKGLEELQIKSSWVDIVHGQGKDENRCPPWWELKYVLFPANMFKTHWVVVILHMDAQRIYILDPRIQKSSPEQVAHEFKCLSHVVPRLLVKTDYYRHIPAPADETSQNWVVHVADRSIMPIQKDANSCGPYVCKYMEDIFLGKTDWSLSSDDDRWSEYLRMDIARTIYNNSYWKQHCK